MVGSGGNPAVVLAGSESRCRPLVPIPVASFLCPGPETQADILSVLEAPCPGLKSLPTSSSSWPREPNDTGRARTPLSSPHMLPSTTYSREGAVRVGRVHNWTA